MTSSRAARASLWILASVIGLPLAARAVTVGDSTFTNADWTLSVFPGGNGGSATATQTTIGGNPLRSVSDTVNNFPSLILDTHIYGPTTYDPGTSGGIASLSYSENAICLAGCFGNGQSTGPAVLQGGILYVYNGSLITGPATTFHPLSLNGLTAADFSRVAVTATTLFDNTQHPDFSSAGAPIQVGFFRANGALVSNGYTLVAGIDDWQVTITPGGQATPVVPTLNPLAMIGFVLLLAAAGVLFLRRL